MIIDFQHTFNTYNEIFSFYGRWDYACPKCHAKHSLIRHGTYHRYLVNDPSMPSGTCRMNILRLKCKSCGSTHAVLTGDMVPYLTYSGICILQLLQDAFGSDGSISRTASRTGLSHQMLYRFLCLLAHHMKSLELLLRIVGEWTQSHTATVREILPFLRKHPPPFPAEEYFRQYRTPLLLSRQSTASYPFFTGASFV